MLTIQQIDGVSPFEWEAFSCPLCEGHNFTSIGHAAVYCDECNARFNVRDTAGDPGCVVDCFTTKDRGAYVSAPVYECKQCDENDRHPLFDWQDKTCPNNLNHGPMVETSNCGCWVPPKDSEYFYMVLKLGDYCSGWLLSGGMSRRTDRRGPTQEEWDAFQEKIKAA